MTLGVKSYASWAQCLSGISGKPISKQAIFGRMSSSWVSLVKQLLEKAIAQQVITPTVKKLFTQFDRVLLQDSTSLHLPTCLSSKFKGNVSKGQTKAVAKLNLIMDIISGDFLFMRWMGFTTTEQSISCNILDIARAGDLVIRDLGYSVLDIFQKMSDNRIYFLSRLRYGITLFDASSKEPLNIAKLLKRKTAVSHWVLCGKEKKVKVRLVAIKLSAEQAARRRRKAKKDRDKRLNHNKQYYELLGYIIFITNVTEQIWTAPQVASAYRIRWNIEILFKSWKSGLNIKNIIPEDFNRTERIESILYMIMLYVTYFQRLIYIPVKWFAEKYNCQISILKLARRMAIETIDWLTDNIIDNAFKKKMMKQCCYDIRHDRINAGQRLQEFYTSLA